MTSDDERDIARAIASVAAISLRLAGQKHRGTAAILTANHKRLVREAAQVFGDASSLLSSLAADDE